MKPFSLYRIIRIDGQYDPAAVSEQEAGAAALESFLAEARSNAMYNGEQDGMEITDITDCGESAM